MFLGRNEILRLVEKGEIVIDPFDPERVGPVSVDLTLGNKFRVFSPDEIELYNDNVDASLLGELVEIEDWEYLELKPGDFVLGITRERIKLPDYVMGILSGRSRFARLGLMVHVSSNIVHPGSNNHQVLEIVNMGPHLLRIHPGISICQISFAKVEGGVPLRGRYATQESP